MEYPSLYAACRVMCLDQGMSNGTSEEHFLTSTIPALKANPELDVDLAEELLSKGRVCDEEDVKNTESLLWLFCAGDQDEAAESGQSCFGDAYAEVIHPVLDELFMTVGA